MARTSTLEPPQRTPDLPMGPQGPRALGGDGGSSPAVSPPVSAASIGVWLLVGAITILFAAFTSTYLARRGEADWHTGPLPAVLWLSTGVLLLSSATMEWARRRGRQGRTNLLWVGLVATAVLGVVFLGAQLTAWRQLVGMGVYLATNPHSSFFYLLTAAHGLHLLGGLAALAYVLARVRAESTPARALQVVEPAAVYWHFLDALWLYLFILLFAF